VTAQRANPSSAVDYPLHHADAIVRPWRTAALLAVAVAAVELVLLVVVGGALLAKPNTIARAGAGNKSTAAAAPKPSAAKSRPLKAVRAKPTPVAVPGLPRRRVSVLVLNGNGRQGAAAATASRVARRGYRIGGVANAPRSDFTRTLVMYRRGFEGEAYRLAKDLRIRIVGPLDGMRPAQLQGAHTVIVVGA
jgi:hypothetical protein